MQARAITYTQSLQDFFDFGILFGMVRIRYVRDEQESARTPAPPRVWRETRQSGPAEDRG